MTTTKGSPSDPADQTADPISQAKAAIRGASDAAGEEIAALRQKVDRLIAERVTPALGKAADQAEAFAHETADRVRDQPFAAVAAAFFAGIAVGVLLRR